MGHVGNNVQFNVIPGQMYSTRKMSYGIIRADSMLAGLLVGKIIVHKLAELGWDDMSAFAIFRNRSYLLPHLHPATCQ